jgi:hypothetical protein
VPVSTGELVYEYNLTNHLGSICTTFTTAQNNQSFTATLEEDNEEQEANQFGSSHQNAMMVSSELYNHTREGRRSLLLNGSSHNGIIGLAQSRKVMAGDRIEIEAFAKYFEPRDQQRDAEKFLFTALVTAFGLTPTTVGEGGQIYESFNSLDKAGLLSITNNGEDNGAPAAFLILR